MATSKTGGVFGFLKGSVGSATYTTSKDSAGKKQQVVRQKATTVANPNTVAQIMQRCKISPAQRFKKALQGILDHSFEGVVYGTPSLQYFLSLAMKEQGPYIPKSVTQVYPFTYTISQGSIPSVNMGLSTVSDQQSIALLSNNGENAFANLIKNNIGSQLTLVAFRFTNGTYEPVVTRTILANDLINDAGTDLSEKGFDLFNGGDWNFSQNPESSGDWVCSYEAATMILSKQDASGNWLRSTQKLVLVPSLLQALTSAEAINLTIASYQTGADVNRINSNWYLNMGGAQAFNGQIVSDIIVSIGDEILPVGLLGANQMVDGAVNGILFTTDGTASGGILTVETDGDNVYVSTVHNSNANYTFDTTDASSLGYVPAKWEPAYFKQLGYNTSGEIIVWTPDEPEP